jgi:hypothetical protein
VSIRNGGIASAGHDARCTATSSLIASVLTLSECMLRKVEEIGSVRAATPGIPVSVLRGAWFCLMFYLTKPNVTLFLSYQSIISILFQARLRAGSGSTMDLS